MFTIQVARYVCAQLTRGQKISQIPTFIMVLLHVTQTLLGLCGRDIGQDIFELFSALAHVLWISVMTIAKITWSDCFQMVP